MDPPEGFAFGDIVRIEKMIPAGHLIVAGQNSHQSITFRMHVGFFKQGHREEFVV